MTRPFKDIDCEALDSLKARVAHAKEHTLALDPPDLVLILDALVTLDVLQENIASQDITIRKLRKLSGIERSSESLQTLRDKKRLEEDVAAEQANDTDAKPANDTDAEPANDADAEPVKDADAEPAKDADAPVADEEPKKKPKKNRRKKDRPASPEVEPEVVFHPMTALERGDDCPECFTGKVYAYKENASFLRITGNSPFTPTRHEMERFRCNTCGAYFTAPLSDEVLMDGDWGQKYGYSARSLMGIDKCFAGLPYYRQESLQGIIGLPLTASTIFDQVEQLANALFVVFKLLFRMAANALYFSIDDTTNRILEQQPIMKPQRNGTKMRLRTGVYTSGLIATMADERKIVLFETNIGHAGEFIDSVLSNRNPSMVKPVIMSDALSSNTPTQIQSVNSLCNAHGRREYVDVISHFPEEVEWVLELYGKIWGNENLVNDKGLSPLKRMIYHEKYSLPIMYKIRRWGNRHLKHKTVEENSGLGKAIRYFDKHYEALTSFCRVEGAKLDNNEMEAQLKLKIRDRKNAMFYKTLHGASIADIVTSVIATVTKANANVFDYFNVVQQEQGKVKANPQNYLPWNYTENRS